MKIFFGNLKGRKVFVGLTAVLLTFILVASVAATSYAPMDDGR